MEVPKFGTRGMFDLFAPGLFLWLNLMGVIYLWPWTDPYVKTAIARYAVENVPAGVALSVVFGYLIGVLLRLFRCERLDRLSALWLRAFNRGARLHPEKTSIWNDLTRGVRTLFRCENLDQMKAEYKPFAYEPFPFFQWIKHLCDYYYSCKNAEEFFTATWAKAEAPNSEEITNRQFFNFRKGLVSAHGGGPSADVYAAEALTRYMAGMFHALVFAAVPVFITGVCRVDRGTLAYALILLAIAYVAAGWVIVKNFRLIRIKEVEALFTADFKLDQDREQAINKHAQVSAAESGSRG